MHTAQGSEVDPRANAVIGWVHRFLDVVRLTRVSSTTLATLGTTITSLIALPVLDIIFNVLLGNDLHAPDFTRIGYASALVALALSLASGIVSKIVTDRELGVFQEVNMLRRFDLAYWLGSTILPTMLSTLTALISIGGVFLISSGHDAGQLAKIVALAMAAMCIGILTGLACAGIGVSLPDPYLGLTIAGSLLPLTSGVIVPTELYPGWLRGICQVMPLTGMLQTLDTWVFASGTAPMGIARDILVSRLWATVGVIFTRVAVHRLRNGVRTEIV